MIKYSFGVGGCRLYRSGEEAGCGRHDRPQRSGYGLEIILKEAAVSSEDPMSAPRPPDDLPPNRGR